MIEPDEYIYNIYKNGKKNLIDTNSNWVLTRRNNNVNNNLKLNKYTDFSRHTAILENDTHVINDLTLRNNNNNQIKRDTTNTNDSNNNTNNNNNSNLSIPYFSSQLFVKHNEPKFSNRIMEITNDGTSNIHLSERNNSPQQPADQQEPSQGIMKNISKSIKVKFRRRNSPRKKLSLTTISLKDASTYDTSDTNEATLSTGEGSLNVYSDNESNKSTSNNSNNNNNNNSSTNSNNTSNNNNNNNNNINNNNDNKTNAQNGTNVNRYLTLPLLPSLLKRSKSKETDENRLTIRSEETNNSIDNSNTNNNMDGNTNNNIDSNTSNSKPTPGKKSSKGSIKEGTSFSFRKLANSISAGADVIINKFNKRPKTQSTFYSDTEFSSCVNSPSTETNEINNDLKRSSNLSTDESSEFDDVTSSLSRSNINLSEKSSINLNEMINNEEEVNDETHDDWEHDSFFNQYLDTSLVDLNDFWQFACVVDEKETNKKPSNDSNSSVSNDTVSLSKTPIEQIKQNETKLKTSESIKYRLWSQLPNVVTSGVIKRMSKKEVELQERWFEIYNSELSYNNALDVLNSFIITEFKTELSDYDMNLIFTRHIDTILRISENFIKDMEERIQSDAVITNFFDIMYKTFSDSKFETYVAIAGEQSSQKENYDRLIKDNKRLSDLVQKIRFDPKLEGKDISSYLIAPVQRLSRYKLLTDAVLKVLPEDNENYSTGVSVAKLLEKLLNDANEKAKKFTSIAESIKLKMLLKYDHQQLIIPNLVSTKRDLLYHSDLIPITPIAFDLANNLTRSKSKKGESNTNTVNNNVYHLILFSDVLIVTIKKFTDEKNFYYRVIQVYNRDLVKIDLAEWRIPTFENSEVFGDNTTSDVQNLESPSEPTLSSYILTLTIKADNQNTKGTEIKRTLDIKYCFICNRLEGEEWVKFFQQKESETTNDINLDDIKEGVAISNYEALKAYELTLSKGDQVSIHKINNEDRMYFGTRILDGEKGWFPSDIITIITQNNNVNNGDKQTTANNDNNNKNKNPLSEKL